MRYPFHSLKSLIDEFQKLCDITDEENAEGTAAAKAMTDIILRTINLTKRYKRRPR